MKKIDDYNENKSYLLAKKRLEELKRFYIHLAIYLIVNLIIGAFKVNDNMQDGDSFYEAITSYNFYLTPFLWGIGLLSHAFKTFGLNFFLGSNWQQKKIDEYMNKKI